MVSGWREFYESVKVRIPFCIISANQEIEDLMRRTDIPGLVEDFTARSEAKDPITLFRILLVEHSFTGKRKPKVTIFSDNPPDLEAGRKLGWRTVAVIGRLMSNYDKDAESRLQLLGLNADEMILDFNNPTVYVFQSGGTPRTNRSKRKLDPAG